MQWQWAGLLSIVWQHGRNRRVCQQLSDNAGKTPSSASAYQVLLTAFPAMHASAYRLLRLLASVCKGALTPLYGGLIAIASSSLQRVASDDTGSFAFRVAVLCQKRGVQEDGYAPDFVTFVVLDMPHGMQGIKRTYPAHVEWPAMHDNSHVYSCR